MKRFDYFNKIWNRGSEWLYYLFLIISW